MSTATINSLSDLNEALKAVPSHRYSFDGYSEDAICLEKKEDVFEVYFAERNQKWELKEHQKEEDACRDMYERLEKYMD